MTRLLSSAALLALALFAALWSSGPSPAADVCALVTKAELEAAFGVPFPPGGDASETNRWRCFYTGSSVFAIVENSRLPPNVNLVAWRAQYRAAIQGGCKEAPGVIGPATFQIVLDLGEEAYACSAEVLISGADPVCCHTVLHAAKGPNILFIHVTRYAPDTLEKLSMLARNALTRLPQ
jgi:hypothetical protein